MKSDFVANISHELTSAQHLLGLINQLLDIAKIESGRLTFHAEHVDPIEVFNEAITTVRAMAEDKRISIRAAGDASPRLVVIDRARLKQILYNYLSNAIKFTPAGGRVELRATVESHSWFRIEVEDTGCRRHRARHARGRGQDAGAYRPARGARSGRRLSEAGTMTRDRDVLLVVDDNGDNRRLLASVSDAVTQRDAGALERGTHSLKGSSGTVGAKKMASLCEDLMAVSR